MSAYDTAASRRSAANSPRSARPHVLGVGWMVTLRVVPTFLLARTAFLTLSRVRARRRKLLWWSGIPVGLVKRDDVAWTRCIPGR